VYALGRFTAALATALAVVAAVIVLQSIPDIRRYLKMRSM
jgi:hypothetical protein